MAALGWLSQLGYTFDRADVKGPAGIASSYQEARGQRIPYRHGYGYRYIAPLVGWLLW